ncbi:hypothetical protein G7072_13025 [Nocardioides sp. HDW12B]|uniref:hypothetical protein n=1 Tax=Nocardioides sp. HDW12B TaxID=2714939 RepID=UPI00140B8D51|nr:hypothetical protein [Nocardioides sp. HDW12B]QIK67142.1 hypothetical protein G7072_13025 [Nocardioides sp. HDW12B]
MRGSLPSFTGRRDPGGSPEPGRERTTASRHDVPLGFDAVGDALASGRCPLAACALVGTALAGDGASVGEALTGLRRTYEVVRSSDPDFAAVEAMTVAWSEATLGYLVDVSCEDPLTGLASQQHLRSRLAEVYRGAERSGDDVRRTHALVVVDVTASARRHRAGLRGAGPVDLRLVRALELATVAEGLRATFSGEETVARLGHDAVVTLVRRTPDLAPAVARLRTLLTELGGPEDARIWVEGLPGDVDRAGAVLGTLLVH